MSWLELFREFEVAHLIREDEHAKDVVLAWYIEVLHRQKKLPELRSLLKLPRQPERQTQKQMKAALEILSAKYGIPLKYKGTDGEVR